VHLQQYDLERHSRSHCGDKPYKCYVCGRPFAMSHHLNNHMTTHTGVRAYECLVCRKRFAQTFSLKRHMKMHLRAAESVAAGDGSSDAGPGLSTDDKAPGFSFSGLAMLQSLSCSVCGKIFSSRQTLMRHRCQLSSSATSGGRTLPTSGGMVQLVSRTRHRCHACGGDFVTAGHLNRHITDIHPNEKPKKPYACSDCDKTFAHPYSLKRHRVEHGGEAHVCASCGKRFAQLCELRRHLKSHHINQLPDAGQCAKSTASGHVMNTLVHPPPSVTASELPCSESAPNDLSAQIAKYVALQDAAQTGLANHLLFHNHRHLPKAPESCDVGLLAFPQSLVVTSAPAAHAPTHSVTAASTKTDSDLWQTTLETLRHIAKNPECFAG